MFKSIRVLSVFFVSGLVALLLSARPAPGLNGAVGSAPSTGVTSLVSHHTDGTQTNEYSDFPSISPDGRFITFTSWATNLIDSSGNVEPGNIYIHDQISGETTLASRHTNGTPGNHEAWTSAVSENGLFVVFDSFSTNLVDDDTNNRSDVFVHSRGTGETSLISRHTDGTQGNGWSKGPTISNDGRYVAFESSADNLIDHDTNNREDIFVHDRDTKVTVRVSQRKGGTEANSDSGGASISGDGRFVAFSSDANNLVTNDSNGSSDVFVHDRSTGEITLISRHTDGTQGNDHSVYPAISSDGWFVAFESSASNLVDNDINGNDDYFVHNRHTGETTLVSRHTNGTQGNAFYRVPLSISGDGRFVAFSSNADNLVSNDTNYAFDVFVHDTKTGETSLISRHTDGTQGNDHSVPGIIGHRAISISRDGRYVAFPSLANNLVDIDINNLQDIFLHDRQITQTFPPLEFLEFPVSYSGSDFVTVASLFQLEGGLVKTRVDHQRAPSSYIAFDGILRSGLTSDNCRTSRFNACYDQADAPDIVLKRGTPVLAAYDGKVVGLKSDCVEGVTGCGDGFGNYVWLDHANCYRTRYSHLASTSVSSGQDVLIGDPVGLGGNTGNSGGPHLDFQVRFDPKCTDGAWSDGPGVIVDPYGWNPFDPNLIDPLSTSTGYLWKHPISSMVSLDSNGGSISNTNNNFTLIVPRGGLGETATIEAGSGQHPAYPGSGWFSIGAGYWFRILEWFNPLRSSGSANQFDVPAEIHIAYEESNLAHMDESTATIHQWDDTSSRWVPLTTTLDTNNNLAMAETLTHGIFNLQAQILCGDDKEPNDQWNSASTIETNLVGLFDSTDDEDWYVVELTAGEAITASIDDHGVGVEPEMELYVNGDVYVDSSDSALVFSAPPSQSKIFYLRVVPRQSSSVGCAASYTLQLMPTNVETHQVYLPAAIR